MIDLKPSVLQTTPSFKFWVGSPTLHTSCESSHSVLRSEHSLLNYSDTSRDWPWLCNLKSCQVSCWFFPTHVDMCDVECWLFNWWCRLLIASFLKTDLKFTRQLKLHIIFLVLKLNQSSWAPWLNHYTTRYFIWIICKKNKNIIKITRHFQTVVILDVPLIAEWQTWRNDRLF